MGFLESLIGGVVKTALTPVAVVKDAIDVVQGDEPKATKGLVNSALDDFSDAIDDATGV